MVAINLPPPTSRATSPALRKPCKIPHRQSNPQPPPDTPRTSRCRAGTARVGTSPTATAHGGRRGDRRLPGIPRSWRVRWGGEGVREGRRILRSSSLHHEKLSEFLQPRHRLERHANRGAGEEGDGNGPGHAAEGGGRRHKSPIADPRRQPADLTTPHPR